MNQELVNNLMKALIQIMCLCDRDEVVFGNAYVEITDRKIEVLKPEDVILKWKQ